MTPAIFLDRDGTVVEEAGYVDRLDRLIFYPFTVDAVRLLNRSGWPIVMISNQSGIGRGLIPESFLPEAHAHISQVLARGGARIDAFFYCPHHPDATLPALRVQCDCRKPAPGMLLAAAAQLDLDLARSVVVGDRWDDVGVARRVGSRGVLVRTGYGRDAESAPRAGVTADFVTDNLAGAAAWILQQS